MNTPTVLTLLAASLAVAAMLVGQDPTGALEGQVRGETGAPVAQAVVSICNLQTGFTLRQTTSEDGLFRLAPLPAGEYALTVEARNFARYSQEPIRILVSQTARVDVNLRLAAVSESVTITADASQVDTSTNTVGNTVSGREVLDLPLNGRNFTQLGLLQAGVAPVTPGVLRIGGTLRDGQAYSVNGQRPESNNYLLDGSENNNRIDGGFALEIAVDAVLEFRILTHTAPAEYGGYAGSTTSVVTRAEQTRFTAACTSSFETTNWTRATFFRRRSSR